MSAESAPHWWLGMLGRLKTLFRINSCSPCTRCRQGKRGDRPRASRRACKPAYEACNRSATTHNRSTTGKRFSFSVAIRNSFTAGVQIRELAEAKLEADDASFTPRRRLRLVRQEDPQKELEKLAFGQCLLAGLRGGQVFEDRHDNNTARNSRDMFRAGSAKYWAQAKAIRDELQISTVLLGVLWPLRQKMHISAIDIYPAIIRKRHSNLLVENQ